MPSNPRPPDHIRATGVSRSLLWARTWQKQGRIQFIRTCVRVNPADVVNGGRRARTNASQVRCPVALQNQPSWPRKAGIQYAAASRISLALLEYWIARFPRVTTPSYGSAGP